MWHNVSKQIGLSAEGWSIVHTNVYEELTELLDCAQRDSQVMAIVGSAGCGKSSTIRQYVATHQEVYSITCSEYQNRGSWLSAVMEAMGLDPRGLSVAEKIGAVVRRLKRFDRPLLILDEADKMSDTVLYFFITWRITAVSYLAPRSTSRSACRRGYVSGERVMKRSTAVSAVSASASASSPPKISPSCVPPMG